MWQSRFLLALALVAGCRFTEKISSRFKSGKKVVPYSATVPAPTRRATTSGKGASGKAAAKFLDWSPITALMTSPMWGGAVVSDHEAVAFTRDNSVGVTKDGGQSWHFYREPNGTVRAAGGNPGGPYVVVGDGGFISISQDGREWADLPRYTNDSLFSVSVSAGGLVAASRFGTVISTDSKGGQARVGQLPKKFRPVQVVLEPGRMVAAAGKSGYDSTDGLTWTPTAKLAPAKGKLFATSRGYCYLGKVAKKRGVVCSLVGTAFGIAAGEIVVVGKNSLALTRDGNRFEMAAAPLTNIKGAAGKAGGPYSVYDAKGQVASSSDGKEWHLEASGAATVGAIAAPKKLEKCDGRLPNAGEVCALKRELSSPPSLPDIYSVEFVGDTGLALGAFATAAMTTDGGATWHNSGGVGLGVLQAFDLSDASLIMAGRIKTAMSFDGGKTFRTLDLPPKTPAIRAAHMGSDGSTYLVGALGLILKCAHECQNWVKLDTGDKNRTDYVRLFEIGQSLFASGSRGELHRSIDGGKSWSAIATGVGEVVQKMASEGELVAAVTWAGRNCGNKLLRSNDGGEHFFVARELSTEGDVVEFSLKKGVLRYDDLLSTDFGATWAEEFHWSFPGSVDVGDGSGVRLVNRSGYRSKNRFYVIGPDKDDITIIDAFSNRGPSQLRCSKSAGCFMLTEGQLLQPS